MINPILEYADLAEYRCDSLDDFEMFNMDQLENYLEDCEKNAQGEVSEIENRKYQIDENNKEAIEDISKLLAQKEAYVKSFTEKKEQVKYLQKICGAFGDFRTLLNGGMETVRLEQTSRYVSYPADSSPVLCFAVKEVRIFSRFPNNAIRSLQLIDLPGLGTCSQSEKKCFLNGFDYSVDLALMIRRPSGITANFPTDIDLDVIKVLESTFGTDHFHEFTILFQNDANLPEAGAISSWNEVENWNQKRRKPLKLIRGDAKDAGFMQETLLSDVFDFMMKNLSIIDDYLWNGQLPDLERAAVDFDSAVESFKRSLRDIKKCFPQTSGAIPVMVRSKEIKDAVLSETEQLLNEFSSGTPEQSEMLIESSDYISDSIDKYRKQAKEWALNEYSPDNMDTVKRVKNEII